MRKTIGAAAIAALALTGAACGAKQGADEGAQVVQGDKATAAFLAQAGEQTSQAGTYRYEITMAMDAGSGEGGFGEMMAFEATGEGAVDEAAGRFSYSMSTDSMLGQVLESVPADELGEVPEELLEDGGLSMQVVVDGDVAYVRSPLFGMLAGDLGDRWIRVDPDEVAEQAAELGIDPSDLDAGDLTSMSGSGMVDPSAMLDWLEGAGAEITDEGTDTVRGVETTKLHATIDVRQLLETSATPEQRDELEQSLEQFGSMGAELDGLELPLDVYVDAEGIVRRMVVATPAAPGDGADGGGMLDELMGSMAMTVTVDFFDLGEPVEITVPDASETVGIAEVIGSIDVGLGSMLPGGSTSTTQR